MGAHETARALSENREDGAMGQATQNSETDRDRVAYQAGRQYADWWVANNGGLIADAPFDDEAKANGFCDRLAELRGAA